MLTDYMIVYLLVNISTFHCLSFSSNLVPFIWNCLPFNSVCVLWDWSN